MTAFDTITSSELTALRMTQDAIEEAGHPKPALAAMRTWADDMETRERNALQHAVAINGYVPEGTAQPLAAARALIGFLDWCIEYREDIETLFRAKLHNKRRRG